MPGMTEDTTTALLQVYHSVRNQSGVQHLLSTLFGPEVADELDDMAAKLDLGEDVPVVARADGGRAKHNPDSLMRCFSKRTLSGIQVREALTDCPKDVLVLYILGSYGYNPQKRRKTGV